MLLGEREKVKLCVCVRQLVRCNSEQRNKSQAHFRQLSGVAIVSVRLLADARRSASNSIVVPLAIVSV